ncbi:hypothetical protein SUVZ_16G0180 [Saccharomyces uvarum]|uniref:Uncharacterized protein n=1 Tax=Saccharomyces uvarum TaxID=230603 RepID=A0ABN8WQ51_SACUV|nr:hypothetical protein SUVZ_16G0180 [Saccharomyces uvarum]
MISPSKKRTALLGKNINQKSGFIKKGNELHSPSKRRSQVDTDYALRRSPIRAVKLTPSSSSQFLVYEETSEERDQTIHRHNENVHNVRRVECDENDSLQVKENLSPTNLQFKDMVISQRGGQRTDLGDLSIDEFKGYIQDPLTDEIIPLTLPLGSKKISLPSFVTPPRNTKISGFFSSKPQGQNPETTMSRSTDDVRPNKVVRKLSFRICEDN